MYTDIKTSVYKDIMQKITYDGNERIGILGTASGAMIDIFFYDDHAAAFEYCIRISDDVLRNMFCAYNTACFIGIVHSHPQEMHQLSANDIAFARKTLAGSDMEYIIMAVV